MIIERYSSVSKLIRVTSGIIWFLWNAHSLGLQLWGPLKVYEIQQATYELIKIVRLECFASEINKLKNNINAETYSKLASLNVFLDAQAISRGEGVIDWRNHCCLSNKNKNFLFCCPQVIPLLDWWLNMNMN